MTYSRTLRRIPTLIGLPESADNRFSIEPDEREDKRTSLQEAVNRLVKPKMTIHLSCAGTIPYGIGYEIMRHFSDRKPLFRIVALGATNLAQLLCATDLVESLVVSYAGDVYPRPNVSAVFQRAFKRGVRVENWSIVSLISRLIAGAMGIEFFPTKSIVGSSMEQENKDCFKVIDDPFGTGNMIPLVKSLRPDLSIVHAWCADRSGNAILVPPLGDSNFGFYASKSGVLLSVEKIVSTEFIRRQASMVKIPGHLVNAVVELPFGAHPSAHLGLYGEGYSEDLEFLLNIRKVGKDEATLKSWIGEWVLGVDHDKYLGKLGTERLMSLVGLRNPDSWRTEIKNKLSRISFDEPCNVTERVIINGSHEVVESTATGGYKVILAGQGISNLSAWIATYALRDKGLGVNLLAEVGFFGYLPRASSPFIFNKSNIPTCIMLTDSFEALGMTLGSRDSIAVLAAAQIDKEGNINDTKVGDLFLVGSGGANDIGSNAKEIVVVVPHEPLRLVKEVTYITVPGGRVTKIVTDQAVFEKVQGEMLLTKYYPHDDLPENKIITEIGKKTGWKLDRSDKLEKMSEETKEEVQLLRLFDPDRYFIGKIRGEK
jgi:acyl CoA:acetate/3-ketoacid CoA transferase alpha subunit/acyl CoA:acetate/3-ketoacid CoA transferase beta subunit